MRPEFTGTLQERLAALGVACTLAGVLVVNALANALPLNGVGTGRLSDEIPNLFVPAGLTFAVWGLIYLLLIGYAVVVLGLAFGRIGLRGWTPHDGWLFCLNMAANAAWIFAWHWRQVALAMGLMLVILATLVLLVERRHRFRLAWGQNPAAAGADDRPGTLALAALDLPLKVYLGWICVATIANLTALLVVARWDALGLDPRLWTVLVIVAALAVGLLFVARRRNYASPLVIVWALAGIVLKRAGTDGGDTVAVWLAALVAAVLLLAAVAVSLVGRRLKGRAADPDLLR